MADDVTFGAGNNATPPDLTIAATDETTSGPHAAGAQMGIAKLAVSANGDSTHVPATAADGLLVNLGANNDVTVTGSVTTGGLTDAQLRATPVPVDVDAPLGQAAMAASIPVVVASNQTAIPVSGTVSTGGLTDAELRATPVPVSGTVTANAGTNLNTSALALEAGGNLAAAAASLAILDNVVAGTEAQVDIVASLPAGTNNIGDVDIASLPNEGQQTMANSISVAVASDQSALTVAQATAASLNAQVVGTAAHASPTSGNPVYIAGRASTAVPTDVGADGDAAGLWLQRNGAPVQTMAPHVGLVGSPWALTGETAQYTTTQTSAVLVAGGASERLVVTKVQIQVGGTTAGTLQLYFGTGAYSRGTNLAIFDGEFAPSATLKPGVIMDGPFISATNGDDLLVTTSAAINPLTITCWYYVVT